MGQDLRQTIIVLFCVTFGISVVLVRDAFKFHQEESLARLEVVRLQVAADLNKVYPEQASKNNYQLPRQVRKVVNQKAMGGE